MNAEAFRNSPSGRMLHAQSGYWAFVPNPLPPSLDWSSSLVRALSEADRALGELAGLGRSLPSPYLFIMPFVRREAVLSSRIEGTRASLPDVLSYEATQLPLFEDATDVREVHNYVRALEYGLARLRELPLSLRLIREIHARLLEGVRGQERTPGEFRTSQNWIGAPLLTDAPFVPPPAAEMRECMSALEAFLYAESDLPPLVRVGMIHYQFEAIHPFLDGNGRIGRLLITLLLCAWGLLPSPLLYLSAYFEARRTTYYDMLMLVSQRGAWREWLTFFLDGVAEQASDAVARARRLLDLREAYRAQLQEEQRASARLLQALDILFGRPVLTVSTMMESLSVYFSTAQRYIDRLAEAGFVREVTGRERNRLYAADGILTILE